MSADLTSSSGISFGKEDAGSLKAASTDHQVRTINYFVMIFQHDFAKAAAAKVLPIPGDQGQFWIEN